VGVDVGVDEARLADALERVRATSRGIDVMFVARLDEDPKALLFDLVWYCSVS
jgi:hypothetical protein